MRALARRGSAALALALALALGCGVAAAQGVLGLELLAPREAQPRTASEVVHVLGRTAPGATVRVGGEPVTVYATGVFARDRVPLARGLNRIVIEASSADGQSATRTLEIERTAPPPEVQWPGERLFLDGASLRPQQLWRVAPGETLEVAVRATPGQQVDARLPGQAWQALPETAAASGRYRARLAFAGSEDVAPAPVQVRVRGVALPRSAGPRAITALTPGAAGQWRADAERLYAVGPEGAALVHGLHGVRLGGPYLAELPPGTLLAATGERGEMLRVQLAPDTTAWVAASAVAPAPAGTPRPQAAFTSLSVAGSDDGDVVTVPLAARVPYAVRAVADAAGRHALEVEIFGAHDASTWITHRASARVVRELTTAQAGPGRVRVRLDLVGPRLWGWREERTAHALRIVVRAAPALAAQGSPLAGLRVALEPGHGSADNRGAVGATGVPEKDVNRWTVEALEAELESVGALVSVVRVGDENPSPLERARRVVESQAQLFVSVHANATDTARGFLRVAGTSVYYKHATGRDAAAAVQRQLLAQTGLEDFGRVGNFNYTPIRAVTWMPAILVEQAFMTHPGDEAHMLDPALRALTARAVRMGLEDFLRAP